MSVFIVKWGLHAGQGVTFSNSYSILAAMNENCRKAVYIENKSNCASYAGMNSWSPKEKKHVQHMG